MKVATTTRIGRIIDTVNLSLKDVRLGIEAYLRQLKNQLRIHT